MSQESWDQYFMSFVFMAASKSKDRSTKVGAIIVKDNEIVTTGYNGFPRKCNDNIEERHNRPLKYLWMTHSETNSLYAAARQGKSTLGCKMYTAGLPCAGCACGIIQAGIIEIIVHNKWNKRFQQKPQWIESLKVSKEMLTEAGVQCRIYDGLINSEIKAFVDGEEWNPNE